MIAAAGRRTSLVKAFAEATHARGGYVVAADVDGLAPSLHLADRAVRTLATGHSGYVADLVAIAEREAIGLLVPTIDPDLPVLASAHAAFEAIGCRVAVASPEFVAITMDKARTVDAFGKAGIRVPKSWIPPIDVAATLPAAVFVKPRQGSASRDNYRTARADLDRILGLVPDPIVQEVLSGPEITIDALLDFEGRPIHYVPRTRLKTIGGESVQGVTLGHDPAFETWIEEVLTVCATLGATGPLTLQAFRTPDGPVLSEINARFGGGFPLALAAGADYPAWLLDMAAGRHVEPRLRGYRTGLYMTRYLVEHFVDRPQW